MKKYRVTKLFIGGILEGLSRVEETSVAFKVGDVISKPCGGTSPYKVVSVEVLS